MKRIILPGLLIFSIAVSAQEFYSTGDCKASFKFEVNPNIYTLLPATAINFYDTSEGNIKAWYWDCGDSITSTEQNPMFIFNHPIGGPTIKLSPYRTITLTIVTDSCKSTYSQTINIMELGGVVQQNCQALYKYYEMSRDSATGKVTFHFDNKSEGKDLSYLWQFGDGSASTEQNPEVTFSMGQPEYKVCLTVTGADSCTSTVCEPVFVQPPIIWDTVITDPVQQNCVAVFKYYEMERDSASGTAKIHFDNYSEGEGLSYFWQFGDGTTSTEKNPEMKFSLNEPIHKACLTVTGADSCTGIMCNDIFIQPPFIWDTINPPVQPDCYIKFGYERKDVLMGPVPSMLVSFYSKSDPPVTEWYWDFGDGTTSNESNPTHVYYQPVMVDSTGVDTIYSTPYPYRTVTLTVKKADGCKTSYSETIQVFGSDTWTDPEPEKCQVYFKYYPPGDVVSVPEVVPIRLEDVSQGEILSRLWTFEDGSTSTEKEPLVSFSIFQPIHKVCLTVTFADSCTNTFCDAVYVNGGFVDTVVVVDPPVIMDPASPYYIKIDGGFPIEMSSCAGWASAKIYLGDSLVTPQFISWSTGDTLSEVKGLCPTQTYTVKALMPDGCSVWTNFVLGADGSVTPVSPVNMWFSGENEKMYVQSNVGAGMKVEWRLCDGTMVVADSIPLDAINCGGNESNMIVKDLMGNVIYAENVTLKGSFTGVKDIKHEAQIKLWPNPVTSKLNIRYSGEYQSQINVEICDVMGKIVSNEICSNISDGYEFSINTGSLKQGIYICRISSGGKIIKAQKFSRR